MKQSKQWLNEVKQLCDELGPEDGVDPRIMARKFVSKSINHHKSQQLCKTAKHVLSQVLMGELSDQLLQNLEVVDAASSDDGQFIFVSIRCIEAGFAVDDSQILNKLQTIQGYLRSVIARSVKRKRVPALKFQLLRAPNEEISYAYSKNN